MKISIVPYYNEQQVLPEVVPGSVIPELHDHLAGQAEQGAVIRQCSNIAPFKWSGGSGAAGYFLQVGNPNGTQQLSRKAGNFVNC